MSVRNAGSGAQVRISTAPILTLSGWEVQLVIPGHETEWLTPAEARELSTDLLAASEEAERHGADLAAKSLHNRIIARLRCCHYHVTGGLAALLGEPDPAVGAALGELLRDGVVERYRGMDGFWRLVPERRTEDGGAR